MLADFIRTWHIRNTIQRCKVECEMGLLETNTAIEAAVRGIALLPEKKRQAALDSLIDFSRIVYDDKARLSGRTDIQNVNCHKVTTDLIRGIECLPEDARKATVLKLVDMITQSQAEAIRNNINSRIFHQRHIQETLAQSYKMLPKPDHDHITSVLVGTCYDQMARGGPFESGSLKIIPPEYRSTIQNTILSRQETQYHNGQITMAQMFENITQLMAQGHDKEHLVRTMVAFCVDASEQKKMPVTDAHKHISDALSKLPVQDRIPLQIAMAQYWIGQGKYGQMRAAKAKDFVQDIIQQLPHADDRATLFKDMLSMTISQYDGDKGDFLLMNNAMRQLSGLEKEDQATLAKVAITSCRRALENSVVSGRIRPADMSEQMNALSYALTYLPKEERAQEAQFSTNMMTISEPLDDMGTLCLVFKRAHNSSCGVALSHNFPNYFATLEDAQRRMAQRPDSTGRQKTQEFLARFTGPNPA